MAKRNPVKTLNGSHSSKKKKRMCVQGCKRESVNGLHMCHHCAWVHVFAGPSDSEARLSSRSI